MALKYQHKVEDLEDEIEDLREEIQELRVNMECKDNVENDETNAVDVA